MSDPTDAGGLEQILARLRLRRERLMETLWAAAVKADHPLEEALERYHLGRITDEAELAPLEEHLLACPVCVRRAEWVADYLDTLRAALAQIDRPEES
jgi:hypothetical protein